MKRTLILALSVAGALGAYAQGTVTFSEVPGTLQVLVYAPQTGSSGVETTGNSAADTPAGSVAYTGAGIGGSATGSGATGYANGANYTAELYGAAGSTATSFSQLSPLTQYSSTFVTKGGSAGAGNFIGSSPANDPGIPGTGTASSASATLSLAAWYSNQGQYATLAAAEAAGVPYGWSPLFTLTGLGGTGSPPATPPNLTGLQSFSLITPTPGPEPGTIALGVMGAAAFLARRRNSK
jgi:hypothetical protein